MKKIDFTIAGTGFRFGQDFFRLEMKVRLIKEPDNEYDKEAVRVEMEGLGKVGCIPAMEELGYMWYYGRLGEQDYGKAFAYFSKGADKNNGSESLWCRYKFTTDPLTVRQGVL